MSNIEPPQCLKIRCHVSIKCALTSDLQLIWLFRYFHDEFDVRLTCALLYIPYWVIFQGLQFLLCTNITFHGSLICALNHWVLRQDTATPIILVCQMELWVSLTYPHNRSIWSECWATPIRSIHQYLIWFQPDLHTQPFSIKSRFSHSDYSGLFDIEILVRLTC